MEWVRLTLESVTGRMGYAAGYKKDLDLEMLDPTGVAVEKWILQGTFLTDVNFDSLGIVMTRLQQLRRHYVLIDVFWFTNTIEKKIIVYIINHRVDSLWFFFTQKYGRSETIWTTRL